MTYSRELGVMDPNILLADRAFNRHSLNDGHHVSPYNKDRIDVGLDNLVVRLTQGIDEDSFKRVLSRAQKATIGMPEPLTVPGGAWVTEYDDSDWEEMLKGGLQTALESQTVVFEVFGVARATTHQIVRSRRAVFHQQSMRASFFGEHPDFRMPESVWAHEHVRRAWEEALTAAQRAYSMACDSDVSYQDARYILPIGTETYIMCEYSVREFLALYAYRACSMFQWEICHTVREMGALLSEAHPWLAPYIKISCQDGKCEDCGGVGYYTTEWGNVHPSDPLWARVIGPPADGVATLRCEKCGGTGKQGSRCTFQGWEEVEEQCDFPQAKEELRTFKPGVHRIKSIGLRGKQG